MVWFGFGRGFGIDLVEVFGTVWEDLVDATLMVGRKI